MGKQEYGKAIAECDRALAINPKFAEAYCTRGDARLSKHDYDKAVADCSAALSLNPKLAEAYNNRGDALRQRGDYDRALANLNKALALNPNCAKAYLTRGLLWSQLGDKKKAVANYNRVLAIAPDDWRAINDLGVSLWIQAEKQDMKAAVADAASDLATARSCREKSVALKHEARVRWNHGITVCPTAIDIHSNLGYAYSDANDLDSAEHHLTVAVVLKPDAPRPRNNLGRVLLRRSQQLEAEARAAEFKGKIDPAEAAKAKKLMDEAKTKRDAAIEQFEKAVELDPKLLEARLNLGGVHLSRNALDKAEDQYREILKLQSEKVKDWDANANFSHAWFGLARVAVARKNRDEAARDLQQAIKLNPGDVSALQLLAVQRYERGEYREGEKCLLSWLRKLPAAERCQEAQQFGRQFEDAGKHEDAVRVWTFVAWAFATSPEPHLLYPTAAMILAQRVAVMTKRQDPLALDALASGQAANGQYQQAVQTAQAAITLASSQGKKALAEAIARRSEFYKQQKPYRSHDDSSDRP